MITPPPNETYQGSCDLIRFHLRKDKGFIKLPCRSAVLWLAEVLL